MAYYELNGKRVYITDKTNNFPKATQQYVSLQPIIQPQLYSEAYLQPQQIIVPTQSGVFVKTIAEEEKEDTSYEYEQHKLSQAPDCKCEFCHSLKCDCHSCNPRRYCKCFYCDRLQDGNKKMLIKRDFLPSEQIQKDLPMTKKLPKSDSSNEIVVPKSGNKKYLQNTFGNYLFDN
ncbi:hypothetical protein BpHYR1_036651 [Brachionus plicatilis]|uniref:Uncharacterized protein n=1 Tax=Brachionus plicatilis TaxID=10195 RepID=A0A3M7SN92_BRAPC|nr:hypothetical protein BpHYR1_036651 [Brachionus plicatilis]